MQVKIHTCPKCGGKMEKGNYSGNPVDWQTDTDRAFLRTEGQEIVTYACEKCGFLESYVKKD